jgi:hypothetical protein
MGHMNHNRFMPLFVLLVLVCAMPTTLHAQPVQQQRATLIIQFSDESHITHCVSFGPDGITGLDLLRRAGLEVATWGTAVCRIEGTGCDYPRERCFCQCLSPPCRFWSYWLWQDGRWVYSQIGAGQHQVRDGDAQAWVWGDGQTPPIVTPEVICPSGGDQPAVQAGSIATLDPPQPPSADTPLSSDSSEDRIAGIGVDMLLREYAVFGAISAALLSSFFWLRLRYQGR